jgi:hypothetical protein
MTGVEDVNGEILTAEGLIEMIDEIVEGMDEFPPVSPFDNDSGVLPDPYL